MNKAKIETLERRLIELCKELEISIVPGVSPNVERSPIIIYDGSEEVYELYSASPQGVNLERWKKYKS